MNTLNGGKTHEDRNATIKAIRTALQQRSGKQWSVKGGRGTAWGWIHIDAPPARRTMRYELKAGAADIPENYFPNDHGAPEGGANTTTTEQRELAELLGLDAAHYQGVSIPAGSDYRREYLARARGETPPVIGTPYWD